MRCYSRRASSLPDTRAICPASPTRLICRLKESAGLRLTPLPSPSLSPQDTTQASRQKRKRSLSPDTAISKHHKRRPAFDDDNEPSAVAYWVRKDKWPDELFARRDNMSSSLKRRNSGSQSSHWSQAEKTLNQNGVYGEDPLLGKLEKDQELLRQLNENDQGMIAYSSYPPQQFLTVSYEVQSRNEARIQRDVMPRVVPSPMILRLLEPAKLDILDEELNSDWTRCIHMGERRPKPDFAIGLSSKAFTEEELVKLQNYTTLEQPTCMTPNLYFPFLMCEAKSGQVGLNVADVQNMHSAALAIRSLLTLCEHAYGEQSRPVLEDLSGRLLAFSVSHNHDHVLIYGHYVLGVEETKRKYYRYQVSLTSLRADSRSAQNFVRNVYQYFAPIHLQRIKDALARLDSPLFEDSASTEILEPETEPSDSQRSSNEGSQERGRTYEKRARRKPSEGRTGEIAQVRSQMGELMKQLQQQRNETERREQLLERQVQQQKEQMQQQMQLQKDESLSRERLLQQQMQQQREQMQQQMQQQREDGNRKEKLLQDLIDTLKSR